MKLLEPNRLRCNGRIGFVKGNRKGYCKNRGVVAEVPDDKGKMPRRLCPSCFEKWKEKHGEAGQTQGEQEAEQP